MAWQDTRKLGLGYGEVRGDTGQSRVDARHSLPVPEPEELAVERIGLGQTDASYMEMDACSSSRQGAKPAIAGVVVVLVAVPVESGGEIIPSACMYVPAAATCSAIHRQGNH